MDRIVLTSHEGYCGIQRTADALQKGASALDAMELGIQQVEDDHRARTVGFGGAPNILGVMECDASIMHGDTLRVGTVGAISGCKHPISAARKVMEVLPHVMLVGAGASRFAREMGIPESDLLSEEAKSAYKVWLEKNVRPEDIARLNDAALAPYISFATRRDLSKGTVTFLVRDSEGTIFGGVSTSGWAYKYPGRLGDSNIIGAGMYVDSRYGGVACTNTGEMTIRAGTARATVLYMKKGATVSEACHEAMADLRDLKGGYLGPVIIHALHKNGDICVLTTGGDDGDMYYLWRDGMSTYEEHRPVISS